MSALLCLLLKEFLRFYFVSAFQAKRSSTISLDSPLFITPPSANVVTLWGWLINLSRNKLTGLTTTLVIALFALVVAVLYCKFEHVLGARDYGFDNKIAASSLSLCVSAITRLRMNALSWLLCAYKQYVHALVNYCAEYRQSWNKNYLEFFGIWVILYYSQNQWTQSVTP